MTGLLKLGFMDLGKNRVTLQPTLVDHVYSRTLVDYVYSRLNKLEMFSEKHIIFYLSVLICSFNHSEGD